MSDLSEAPAVDEESANRTFGSLDVGGDDAMFSLQRMFEEEIHRTILCGSLKYLFFA